MIKFDKKEKKQIITVTLIIISIILLSSQSYTIINAGERGILLTLGSPQETALSEGLHLKIPFVQTIERMDVKILKFENDINSASKDLQVVSAKIAVNYHIEPTHVPLIYKSVGKSYESIIIQPAMQEVVKSITAKFTASELITNRTVVKDLIEEKLSARLLSNNILVNAVSITNFDFSPSFNQAIEAKVTAEQQAQKAQNDLQRINIENEQKISIAQAEATVVKTNADANSYQIKVKGEADSYALQLIQNTLKSNPEIIKYKTIEKWNGQVPTYSGAGLVPFLDVNTGVN